MSYDIYLDDPKGVVCQIDNDFKGGIYALGGSPEAWINVTYNYSQHYREHIDAEKGIRWIYGKTGAEVLPRLKEAVSKLGVEPSEDYWEPTPGNAGRALLALIAFAEARPDGVFSGD